MISLLLVGLRTSVVLLAGLGLRAALRRRSASLRHAVLTVTIVGASVVLPCSLLIPSWDVHLWPARRPLGQTDSTMGRATAGRAPIDAGITQERTAVLSTPAISTGVIVWSAGFSVGLIVLLIGTVRLARMTARATRVVDGTWASSARAVAASYGLRDDVVLLQTDVLFLLATWGLRPARVLLPSQSRDWTRERIHVVLCHELAHVSRRDWLVLMAAQGMLAALWFNPLMWVACRLLRQDSELACDDAVLERNVEAVDYAEHLVAIARECRRPGWTWVPALAMARRSSFERRIAAMLNPRLDRSPLSRRSVAATAALLLTVTLSVASLRAIQAQPAALSGTVYDVTGAVLPGVVLTLQDAQLGKATATTDPAGRFTFPGIGTGEYVLSTSLPGFRELRQDVTLATAPDWDRAVTLQVGDMRETISVSERRLPPSTPSASAANPPRVRVGGNIRAPRKELDVHPTYPAAMREAGREGTVPIEAVIGRDGTVTTVRVLSAQVHPDFAIAAVDAVRQWRFSPTLLNGTPVEVVMNVSVRFSLSD